jgi:ferredoxin
MKRILIVYHSASGSTKLISEILKNRLAPSFKVDVIRVPINFNYKDIINYDFLIFGFPTFYLKPTPSISDFVEKIPKLNSPIKAFVFTTLGLYAENCLRIFINQLLNKNIITGGSMEFRGPGTDTALLFPISLSSPFRRYEKRINQKINKTIMQIKDLISSEKVVLKIPKLKWYTPISKTLQFVYFDSFANNKFKLHILKERCTNCKLCINTCLRGCWNENNENPIFNPTNCEFCLGCVHHCPEKAIIFSKSMKDKPRLNKKFYIELKKLTFPDDS